MRGPIILLLFASAIPLASSFLSGLCREAVVAKLKNGTLSPTNDTVFYQNKDGVFESDPDAKITLTLFGCMEQCGKSFAFFDWNEIVGKLSTWLLPVLLLLANMHWTPIGHIHAMCSIVHLLGDPIDAIWSLLTKHEVARRVLQLGLREWTNPNDPNDVLEALELEQAINVATVIVALEEVADTNSKENREELRQQVVELRRGGLGRIARLAYELYDVRLYALFPTVIAILVYLVNLGMAFVMAVQATRKGEKPPGNRVGFAMIFSWLVPVLLLSAETGRYVSRRVCSRILRQCPLVIPYLNRAEENQNGHKAAYHAQAWSGVVYTFRPQKRIFTVGNGDRSPFCLFLIATGFVFLSCAAGFAIGFVSPTVGLSCRPLCILVFGILWLFSVGISFMFHEWNVFAAKTYFWVMTIKDALITIFVVGMIVLFYAGLDNSCWCWSNVYGKGPEAACVQLDVDDPRAENNRSVYPAIVFPTIIIQLCMYALLRWKDRDNLRRKDSELEGMHLDYNRELEN
jgi:hypothetical protein